jgi:predicted nucleic acid-binding protein
MRFLLDTCVISELVSKQSTLSVVDWIDGIEDERLFLSVLTIGEIQRGIEKLPDSKRKQNLSSWLKDELLIRFYGRVLPLDLDVMLEWGILVARLERVGRPLPAMDSLIAALARRHDLHLVTRNEQDFADTGISIINPWQ